MFVVVGTKRDGGDERFWSLWDRLILFVTCCYREGLFITRVGKRTLTNLLSVAKDRARLIKFD